MLRRRLSYLLAASMLLVSGIDDARAADPCGIGGTGWLDEVGIGGTGLLPGSGEGVGIGGTGQAPGEVGVGGTGHTREGNGIGGTGRGSEGIGLGGTGFAATITGFGSICLGGARVAYDDDVSVRIDGMAAGAEALAIGQVVVVDAVGAGSQWRAERIDVVHAVVGPIESIERDAGDKASLEFTVLGQRVRAAARAASDVAALSAGQWVMVSGLRAGDGAIDATLVETTDARSAGLVRGPVRLDDDGVFIGGLAIASIAETSMARWRSAADGWDALAMVEVGSSAVRVTDVTRGPMAELASRQATMVVEATVARDAGGAVGLAGLPVAGLGSARAVRGDSSGLTDGTKVHVLVDVAAGGTLSARAFTAAPRMPTQVGGHRPEPMRGPPPPPEDAPPPPPPGEGGPAPTGESGSPPPPGAPPPPPPGHETGGSKPPRPHRPGAPPRAPRPARPPRPPR
jgi:hypothetical protein